MEPKTVDLPGDQLLVTLQAGDITAFEMIFKTYYQPLCNYAYSFVHDRDEAEEIVQAAFLSVWEKRENLNIHTGVKPYLYAMVRNAALNVLKHEKNKTTTRNRGARDCGAECGVGDAHSNGVRIGGSDLHGVKQTARTMPFGL